MALTYLAGGRSLTGVIFQPRCHQQHEHDSPASSTTVSPTLRPLVSAIGGISSFLTRQTLSPPSTSGNASTSDGISASPSPSITHSSLESTSPTNNETTSHCTTTAPTNPIIYNNYASESSSEKVKESSDGGSLILRRVGLDTITQTLANTSCVTGLVDLNLTRNHLTDLPDILSILCHLQSLNVAYNLFTTVPSVLLQMRQLISLNLSDNQLAEIPFELPFALPNLMHLLLFGNILTSLPSTISHWAQLQCLQLGSEFSGNRLTELPENLPPGLKMLDISHNRLDRLPLSVTHLKHLVQLDASYNLLQSLPNHLLTWQQIQSINMSNNRLTLLPPDLVELDALVSLNVSYNFIHVFPEGLLENRSLNVVITGNPLSYPGQHQSAFSRVTENHQPQQNSSSSSISASDSDSGESDSETSENEQEHGRHHQNEIMETNSLPTSVLFQHLSSTASPSSTPIDFQQQRQYAAYNQDEQEDNHDPGVNSLYELAFRQILQSPSETIHPDILPNHLSQIQQDGDKQAHTCIVCKGPYLREWVSSTYCKNYRGYPSVVRKIRFCSRQCSIRHAEKARQLAERQEANNRMVPPGPMDLGSFEWIVAAADAAREQQADEEDWF